MAVTNILCLFQSVEGRQVDEVVQSEYLFNSLKAG